MQTGKSESDWQSTGEFNMSQNLHDPTSTELKCVGRTQKNNVSWSTTPTSAKFGSWCCRLYSASSNAMLRIYTINLFETERRHPGQNYYWPNKTNNRVVSWPYQTSPEYEQHRRCRVRSNDVWWEPGKAIYIRIFEKVLLPRNYCLIMSNPLHNFSQVKIFRGLGQ